MAARFVLTVVICFVIVLFGAKSNAQGLESPCPRLFAYESHGREKDRWYGRATLISDSELTGIWVRLIFDSPSLQLGTWFGDVKTDDNVAYLVKNRTYKFSGNIPYPLRFYVKYDPNKPVPRLVSFQLNGKTVCPEGQATAPPPPTSGQLFSNTSSATSPPTEVVSSQTNLPDRGGSNNEDEADDYFKGDFSGFNIKPGGIGSNIECGTIAVQARPLITYGQKTLAGEFPWHAALYHSRGVGLDYICGGSLISRQHIITVAHCVSRPRSQSVLNPENLLIYLGKYYLNKWSNTGVQDYQVSKIIRHPQYDSRTYADDIAIIKLRQPAVFTDYVRPVCLWDGPIDLNPVVGKYGTVVGWGFGENGKLTEELTMVNMPIIAKDICIYSFRDFFSRFTTSETFCAGFNNGTSVCNGDSGGGMVFQKETGNRNKKIYHLRGLVSVSVALQNEFKCDPQHYVVFTDVAMYSEFIKQALVA